MNKELGNMTIKEFKKWCAEHNVDSSCVGGYPDCEGCPFQNLDNCQTLVSINDISSDDLSYEVDIDD